ncbi:hypothetical protein [Candidatus Chlamydia sanziniae]|uniref:Uncharacterized protein n=1 Tax=Candidatus Chlamydia sanziniae TaxID=1806891 RepID=A0A1A9HTB5_9CHLA|nr:hypothetical protein [Candidatus Chlamydia sanziniae]ANH78228.1 hypothetical protein Cs308_0052 [Candidatus Chlamydia sanziniae]
MSCGFPNLDCYYREQHDNNPEQVENIPLQPVTQQPKSRTREFGFSLGETTLLDIISGGGKILSNLLNSNQVQRTGRYCDDTCSPWCEETCPRGLNWLWHCCCICLLNPPMLPDEDSLALYLQSLREKFGPICLYQALCKCSGICEKVQAEGRPLSDSEKNQLENACQQAQGNLKSLVSKNMGNTLTELLSDSGKAPNPDSPLVSAVRQAEISPRPGEPPVCWILQPPSPGEGEPTAPTSVPDISPSHYNPDCRSTCKLNPRKLEKNLSHLQVTCLYDPSYQGPLGHVGAKSVVATLLKALVALIHDHTDLFTIPGVGLSLELNVFNSLLLLCLLIQGYLPLDPLSGETPFDPDDLNNPWTKVLNQLIMKLKISDKIKTGRGGSLESLVADCGFSSTDHSDGATLGPTPKSDDNDNNDVCWNPQEQERLLQQAIKTQHIFLG